MISYSVTIVKEAIQTNHMIIGYSNQQLMFHIWLHFKWIHTHSNKFYYSPMRMGGRGKAMPACPVSISQNNLENDSSKVAKTHYTQ